MIELKTPITDEDINKLKAGDVISISGQILTARDQAHKRILEEGAPIDIEGAVLFHAGPIIQEEENENDSEPKYKMVAVGPTTSMRMNPYEADVLDMGAKIIIGKGGMDDSVREALKRNNAVYVVATGGCAALYVDKVNEIKGVSLSIYFLLSLTPSYSSLCDILAYNTSSSTIHDPCIKLVK